MDEHLILEHLIRSINQRYPCHLFWLII